MKRLAILLAALAAAPLAAQPSSPPPSASPLTRMAPPAEPDAIPLYPGVAPGSEASKAREIWGRMDNGQRIVRNVVRPTITPVLPDPAKATGAAVIVAPGGAFKILAMDNEGWPVARWLADRGVAAFVLKYRLNETPDDERALLAEASKAVAAAAGGSLPNLTEPRATQDALRALAVVRGGASRWKIDPQRVGLIGFSAGAITALNAVREAPAGEGPAFLGYIYGPMLPVAVPAAAPPMFAALALDDPLFGRQGFGIVEAWRRADRPAELHAYEKGDHGYGMGRPGTTTVLMMEQFLAWLDSRGVLKAR